VVSRCYPASSLLVASLIAYGPGFFLCHIPPRCPLFRPVLHSPYPSPPVTCGPFHGRAWFFCDHPGALNSGFFALQSLTTRLPRYQVCFHLHPPQLFERFPTNPSPLFPALPVGTPNLPRLSSSPPLLALLVPPAHGHFFSG